MQVKQFCPGSFATLILVITEGLQIYETEQPFEVKTAIRSVDKLVFVGDLIN